MFILTKKDTLQALENNRNLLKTFVDTGFVKLSDKHIIYPERTILEIVSKFIRHYSEYTVFDLVFLTLDLFTAKVQDSFECL